MREKTHPRRRWYARASPRGGGRRSPQQGSRLRCRLGPRCVPDHAAFAQGKRLSTDKASPSQERNLRDLIVRHLQRETIRVYQDLTVPTLAKATGLGERTVLQLLHEVRKPNRREAVEFAAEILRAMLLKRIAGVLGTRRTRETRAMFKIVRGVTEAEGWSAGLDSFFREWKAAFDFDYDLWERE